MGTIILTSNGITGTKIGIELKKYIKKDMKNAVIITTASDNKGNDKHIPIIKSKLESYGLLIELIDIEFEPIERLRLYDIIYIMGGNPFYLLHYLRKADGRKVFEEILHNEKIIIGSSASSVVLGPSVELVNEFEPDMNKIVKLPNFDGLGLTQIEICPHASVFVEHYDNFMGRIVKYEKLKERSVYLINDEEAIFINSNTYQRI
jgi:dipeptidase E